MGELEHEGDRITHDIAFEVARTFVLDIERGDALRVTSALDDVVDYIDEVAELLTTYRVQRVSAEAVEMAELLSSATARLARALHALDAAEGRSHRQRVVDAEREGDRILRRTLAELFDHATDPLEVLRWKDIYARLEAALDAARGVSQTLESIEAKLRV